jgi:creatinine amidohydrolase/Fe(II)-dependent formamide hydrolase-like protein
MLMALGINPSRCGYKEPQIEHCLKALTEKEIHQAAEDVQHLAFLLGEKGVLAKPNIGSIKTRKRIEIMKVRFDAERSPLNGMPVDLREPLFGIFLDYADGAVKRNGRLWIDYDPLTTQTLSRPYPFESPHTESNSASSIPREPAKPEATYLLGELTWPEAKIRFKEVDLALLPVGAIEQHGPHLPLDTDTFDADYLARQVAATCSDPKPLVLPMIPYGVSYHHASFSGTISISPETLSRLVYEVGMSAARNGITKLVIINGHGGNIPALQFAAQMINRDAHIFTCVDTGETSAADVNALIETPNDVHAGEIETSTSLAVRPQLVRLDKASKFIPRFSSGYLNFSSTQRVEWFTRTSKLSPTGVLGDPSKASREKGTQIWALMIKHLVKLVEDLKRMSLDELHQKQY